MGQRDDDWGILLEIAKCINEDLHEIHELVIEMRKEFGEFRSALGQSPGGTSSPAASETPSPESKQPSA
jgi:hypothetical protein